MAKHGAKKSRRPEPEATKSGTDATKAEAEATRSGGAAAMNPEAETEAVKAGTEDPGSAPEAIGMQMDAPQAKAVEPPKESVRAGVEADRAEPEAATGGAEPVMSAPEPVTSGPAAVTAPAEASKTDGATIKKTETRRMQKGKAMHDTTKVQELFTQGSGKAVETMTLWADANQRVLREIAELSAATAKEGVRLYAELQQASLEVMRDAQAAALRWQAIWHDAPRDPLACYQRVLTDGVENTQKWFRLLEGNAQAVTRTAERLQATAEQAGKGIQESFSETVTKMKDVYAA